MIKQNGTNLNYFLESKGTRPVTLRSDYDFSYNPKIKNKSCPDKREFVNFPSLSGSIDDLVRIISSGKAFSPSVFSKGTRGANNFVKCDILAIDIDNTDDDQGYNAKFTLEDAQNHPFIKKYGIIYTSPSHKDTHHKFRIIFVLPYSLDNPELVKENLKLIDEILGGDVIDKACIDVARLFYGNDNAQWFNIENAYDLPIDFIECAKERLAKAQEKREIKQREYKERNESFETTADEVQNALNAIPADVEYQQWVTIMFALFNYFDGSDEGFTIFDNWSSQGSKYDGTESLYRKWLTAVGRVGTPVTVASLFHIAKEYGYQVKSKSEYGKVLLSGEEALAKARQSISQEDISDYSVISENDFRKAVDNKEFSDFQEAFIRQLNNLSKNFEKGFSNRIIDMPNLNFTEITFHPDTFFKLQKSDLQDEVKIIIPIKYCNPVLRAKIINHLRVLGVKYCFDRTQTGGGKSTTISLLNNILYLDSNYKNPSNPQLQETPYLSPRTEHGLYMVNGEIKADPSEDIRVLADDANHPNIFLLKDGNCVNKSLFLALQNNGYGTGDNLPCQGCIYKQSCHFTTDFYKHETSQDVANILKAGQGRMHPAQLSAQRYIETFSKYSLVWEEVGTLPVVKELLFTTSHLDNLIVQLAVATAETIVTEKKEQLIQVLNHLKFLITQRYVKSSNPDPEEGRFYGFNYADILKTLPDTPDLTPEEYLLLMGYLNPLHEGINEELLSPNVMKLLDAVLAPNNKTILSTHLNDFGLWVLGVSYFDDSYSILSKKAKFNFFMDATATITQVKSIFEIEDSEPLVIIQNEIVELNNLNIFNINLQGLGSNEWSQESIDRTKEAVRLIRSQNPNMNIAVMTLKRYADELETNYWYGKHDRGTNELKDYDAIIFVGTPFINVGSVQREYEILFSGKENSPTFEQFYNQKIYELRMQGMGRSRAQYRNTAVHQYYLTTGEDLSYLKELGVNYREISGASISPALSTKGDRTMFKVKNVVVSMLESGVKVTCQAVADNLGLTKQAISKAVKIFGFSWKDFIFCQLRLLDSYIGKVDKNRKETHWSAVELREDPIALIQMSIDNIAENGIDGLFEMIEGLEMPYHIASRLLWILSPLFDERFSRLSSLITEQV